MTVNEYAEKLVKEPVSKLEEEIGVILTTGQYRVGRVADRIGFDSHVAAIGLRTMELRGYAHVVGLDEKGKNVWALTDAGAVRWHG
jgi:hypothetical protein